MESAAQPRPRRSQQERVAESAQRLLDAAIALIAEQGYERTTTAEISERAGYSKAMVHVRYGSKEALLETLLRSYEDRLIQSPMEEASGLDELLAQVDVVRARAREDPHFLRAFFVLCFETVGPVTSLRSWLTDWLGRYVDRTAATLRRGQRDGSVRAELDPELEARRFLDLGTGLIFRWCLDPESVDFDAELEQWREHQRAWLTTA